jgi:8-oxo-dGTP pyrophosphatase MutT (NUDIX family)
MTDLVTPEWKHAAVGLLINRRRNVLQVWNKKLLGWSLPGGKQDPADLVGRVPEAAIRETLRRELREETGIALGEHRLLGVWEGTVVPGVMVHVFHVLYAMRMTLVPEWEDGCPVEWASAHRLFDDAVFGSFYRGHFPVGFDHLEQVRGITP